MPHSTGSLCGTAVAAFALISLMVPQPHLAAQQPVAPTGAYAASPYLGEIRDAVLYGDILGALPALGPGPEPHHGRGQPGRSTRPTSCASIWGGRSTTE